MDEENQEQDILENDELLPDQHEQVIENKTTQRYFWRKRILGVISIKLLAILIAGVVIAGTIGYIASVNISGTKAPVIEIRESLDGGATWGDWQNGEQLDITWDFGDVLEYSDSRMYEVKTTAEYDLSYADPIDILVTIIDDPECITVTDTLTGDPIADSDQITITPGISYGITISIDIGLWTYSGYGFDDISVKLIPITT